MCLIFSFAFSAVANTVKILGPRADIDPVYDYFKQLTILVLSKTSQGKAPFKLKIINGIDITQQRTLRFLDNGFIDVVWAGTDIKREQAYLPVYIPLFGGLLGYRVSLIRRVDEDKFKNISPNALKKLIACQGDHWPDADILEDNGYKVSRVVHYDAMFKMLASNRCDYFPRSIYEGYAEQKAFSKEFPGLMVMDNFILHYQFPFYYFVKHGNSALAKRLKKGLLIALKDGSWLRLMKTHPVTKNLFPLSKWHDKRFFELKNREITIKTLMQSNSFLFQLQKEP